MNGGTDLRLNPAMRNGADPGRSADSKLARSSPKSASPFEALLARPRLGARADAAASAEARPLARSFGADVRNTRTVSLAVQPDPDAETGATGASAVAEVVKLDAVPQGQTLAHQVAERIAASLGDRQAAASDGAASEDRPDTGPVRGERASPASLALSTAMARKLDAAGLAAGGPTPAELSVTRRETHFGPMLPGAGTASGGQEIEGDAESAPKRKGDRRLAPEPAAIRQGRSEQMMTPARAGTERAAGSAMAPDSLANALGRTVVEDAKPGGGAQQASGETARWMAFGGVPGGLTGPADARGSGQAAGVAQPGGAASAFPATAGPVKVLHMQLHPAELGMLEIRMKLSDAGLELHIAASRHETLALLKSDQDALANVIRGAGHALEEVTVTLSDKSGASGQPSQDGWQPPASGARPEAQSGSAREQGGRFDDRSSSRSENGFAFEQVNDDQDQSVVAVRPSGGLYL